MSNCTNRPTPWSGDLASIPQAPASGLPGSAPVVVVAPPPAPVVSVPAPVVAVTVNADPSTIRNIPPIDTSIAATLTYRRPVARKPVYARSAGQTWSTKEEELVSHAYKTAGLQAAYNAVPHRSHPAVRGWLQRRGLIAKTPAPVATV